MIVLGNGLSLTRRQIINGTNHDTIHWRTYISTHCGLVTPYGGRDLGQHWFRQWPVAWRHQAITWTNVNLSSLWSIDVHLRAVSVEISQPSVTKISLNIIFLRFYWNLPGVSELTRVYDFMRICVLTGPTTTNMTFVTLTLIISMYNI